MTTRLLAFVLTLVLLAPVPSRAQTPRARVWLPGYAQSFLLDTLSVRYEIAAPPGRVVAAVADVMTAMKIPVEVRDSVAGVVGVASTKKRQQLGGVRMSVYLYCGDGMVGAYADRYQITFALLVLVDPGRAPGTTEARVGFAAGGRDIEGGALKDPVVCQTNGKFERRLVDEIQAKLGLAEPPRQS